MGRMWAAFHAGMMPAMVPAMIITSVASMHTSRPTVGLTKKVALNKPVLMTSWPSVASIYSFTATPITMPI